MKHFVNSVSSVLKKLILCIFISFLFTASFAGDFPEKPNTLVSDFTQTLSVEEQQSLEQKLVAFNDSTSTQIAVVIIQSVGGYEIKDYAAQLGEKWGIGQKGKNNGLILLVAKGDRKVAIQVGYGLEPVITDALSRRIIETIIVPAFKQKQFYGGLDEATNVLMSVALGEFTADQYVKQAKDRGEKIPWGLFPVFFFIIIILIFSRARSVGRYARTNNVSFWAALALMNAMSNRSSGSWGNFSSGSGGFGGFGGGSFGGGGASGSW